MADRSVRVAWAADIPGIGAVQSRAWRAAFGDLFPADVLDGLTPESLAQAWGPAILLPPTARQRVLVAFEGDTVAGFAATSPAADPDSDPSQDGEIALLIVDPQAERRGHGSRLLAAAVDTLRADGFGHGVTWLPDADHARRDFLTKAGWAPDGALRTLDLLGDATVTVRQQRLHTDLRTDPA